MTSRGDQVPPEGFEVAVRYSGEEAAVTPKGELDLVTLPHLAGVMDAVIDRRPAKVALDLSGVTFMGVGGLGIIAAGAGRLAEDGGRLVLRTPSSLVQRMIEITGLQDLAEVEGPPVAASHLAAEQPSSGAGAPAPTLPGGLTHDLRRLTSIPADDDVVDGALRLVVALARLVVQRADGVSISLDRHGRLATVAASDQTISSMDIDQYAAGEGPCVDASRNGRWFHAESLEQETRWPAFTPKALELGINAILSTPLVTHDRPVGAINMYSRTARAFACRDEELAAAFASEASLILTHAGIGVTEDDLASHLAESLRLREVIAQAQGILMDREALSADEAYATLRRFAVGQDRTFAELAAEVVASARHQA